VREETAEKTRVLTDNGCHKVTVAIHECNIVFAELTTAICLAET
jgi:hypothetical protein